MSASASTDEECGRAEGESLLSASASADEEFSWAECERCCANRAGFGTMPSDHKRAVSRECKRKTSNPNEVQSQSGTSPPQLAFGLATPHACTKTPLQTALD